MRLIPIGSFCVLHVKARGQREETTAVGSFAFRDGRGMERGGLVGGFAALPNRATLLRPPGVSRLMFSFLRSAVVAALLLASLQLMFGDDTKAPAIRPELATADQLYRAGKFAEAEASYQALLSTDSKLVPAQVGLVRAMLRQQKLMKPWTR